MQFPQYRSDLETCYQTMCRVIHTLAVLDGLKPPASVSPGWDPKSAVPGGTNLLRYARGLLLLYHADQTLCAAGVCPE